MPEIENPVLVDAEAEKLLQMASRFDQTGEYEPPEDAPTEIIPPAKKPDAPKPEETPEPETPEPVVAKERDAKGKFLPKTVCSW